MEHVVDRKRIGRTNRKRGNTREREARVLLKERGWLVIKSGASITPADLIAGRRDSTIAVQVKATRPTKKDYEEIITASAIWWIPWVMLWKPKGKHSWSHQVAYMGSMNQALEASVLNPK